MNDSGRAGCIVFGSVCILVIGIFAWSAGPGFHDIATQRAEDGYYNLLVQGFRAGQLNVKRDAPPGLASVPNPYDSAVNKLYVWNRDDLCHDMSYYKGKLYLYFGVVPALTLYWPYVVLTGHYLPDKDAVMIFFAVGFLISAGLLYAIWRRYFPEAGVWVMAAGVIVTGLATGILELLPSCDVYETAVSGGFAFAMLAFAGIWKALHEPNRKMRWQLLASLFYGLAVGSRPSLLFGGIILLAPVAQEWFDTHEPGPHRRAGLLLVPTAIPIVLVGLGLMLYNYLRFESPFEFGWHYLLTAAQNTPTRQFSLGYFWFNARFYFVGPMCWTSHFPFLDVAQLPPLPSGHGGVESPYSGIITGYPIACFALAAPLAWMASAGKNLSPFRWFVTALVAFFLICALTICLFFSACNRYQIDFVPVLMLLAVIGIFGLEQTLQNSIAWRRVGRVAWCLLLAYSILFNVFAAVKSYANHSYLDGNVLLDQGRVDAAIEYFKRATRYDPQSAAFHFALANALSLAGKVEESIIQYQDALGIRPNDAEAANNLAFTLLQAGQTGEAIKYFQIASKLQKSYQAFYNLSFAFRMNKMPLEAETNLQKAVELQPQFMPAQIDLSWILATWPDATARNGARALAIAESLNHQHPDDPKILRTLAAACAETGHFPEAVANAKQALVLAQTLSQTTLAGQLQAEARLYQSNNPCRSFGH
jgi:tetratricopeptide (TPR) repeat protein